ncbi:MAG: AcrR family transcriptional regulator [Oleiphilaceae bacterium]|jgi:AcrR family transcriptional regulator
MSYRPTDKTEARKKSQHALLLSSAMKIVSIRGFQALTIAAVAEEANVAIGTVYKYFESKALLCTEVFRQGSEREVHHVRLAAFPETPKSCKDRLTHTIQTFAERAIAGHRLAYALIGEPVDPLIEIERLIYRQSYADIFDTLISEGIEMGEFLPQDTRVTAAALVGTLSETLIGPLGPTTPCTTKAKQRELVKNIQIFCLRAVIA